MVAGDGDDRAGERIRGIADAGQKVIPDCACGGGGGMAVENVAGYDKQVNARSLPRKLAAEPVEKQFLLFKPLPVVERRPEVQIRQMRQFHRFFLRCCQSPPILQNRRARRKLGATRPTLRGGREFSYGVLQICVLSFGATRLCSPRGKKTS